MATYPPRGSTPWDNSLKAYVDDRDAEVASDALDMLDGRADFAHQPSGPKDADTFVSSGRFYILTNTGSVNFPSTNAGMLEVRKSSSNARAFQIYTGLIGSDVGRQWSRSNDGTTWSPWREVAVKGVLAATDIPYAGGTSLPSSSVETALDTLDTWRNSTDPLSQYARLDVANEFTFRQTFDSPSLGVVLRRRNAPEDLKSWGLYGEVDGSLVIDPLLDSLLPYPGSGRMRIFRDGRIQRSGIMEITGTGNPNSVHAAPIGSTFRNTEAGGWNGARVWRKDSGTGASGWVVESGDTGTRNVSADVTWDESRVDTTVNPLIFRVTRTASVVELYVYWRTPTPDMSTSAGPIVSALPTGFRPSLPTINGLLTNISANNAINGGFSISGATGIVNGRLISAGILTSLVVSFRTTDPWPTTLPGTPA